MAGESWWQDLGVAGHIASSVRKQRERERCLGAAWLPLPFLIQPGSPARRMASPMFRMGLPAPVNVIWGTTSQVSPELCLYGDLKSCQVGKQDKPAYSTSCSTSTGGSQVTEREELQMVARVKASSPPESPSSRGRCPHSLLSYQLITALWVSQIMVLQYLQRSLHTQTCPALSA